MRKFAVSGLLFLSLVLVSFTAMNIVRPDAYFTKGSTLHYTLTAENGAKSYTVVKITDVIQRGKITEIDASDNYENDLHKSTFTYRLTYFADSLNWCVQTSNYLNIPLVYSSNFTVSLRSDSLLYPYNMKIGDTLPQGSASELIITGTRNERYIMISNRKVTAWETGMVDGKSVTSFKIESIMTKGSVADYGALGKIPTEAKYNFTEWFVPSMGVVKTTLKSATGETSMVLEGFK